MASLRPFFALTAALLLLSPLQAQPKEWPVPRGASREPDPIAFNRAMLKDLPDEYLQRYSACYLRAATWYLIEPDGTVEATTHEIIRLNNRKGVEQFGEHRNVTFRPEQEKLVLNEARVHKPDGSRIIVEPKHVQVRDVATDYFVYDSTKELIISYPGLEVGDVIETKWTTRGKNPEYAGRYFSRYQFGDERSPIWKELFGVRVPRGQTLKYALTNPHLLPKGPQLPEISEEKGDQLFVWRASDRRPVVKEDHLPSKEELRPGVAISTFASWEEVAGWERKIRAQCWECTPELKKIVEQVKREHTAPEDIARELTYWVRGHIRYVSSGDRHDFTPHAPAVICKNRFGDCKDGVQLLSVLLKEAGIPSQQVSLNVAGDGQILESVPSPLTTHAILLVTINGKDHWIDTTASHAAWDFLPKSDRDRLAYAVDDKKIQFLRTPKLTAGENRSDAVTAMRIDPDGTGRNLRELTFHGAAALEKREEWLDVSGAERRKSIRAELLDGSSRVKLSEKIAIDENSLGRFHHPVTAKFEFEVPRQLQGQTEMEGSVADNSLWGRLLSVTVDTERTLPIELKEPFESRQTFVIEAPPGYRLAAPPENRNHSSKWGSFRRSIEVSDSGRRWTVLFHTRLEKTRIEPADFEAFLDFQERVSAGHRAYLTMKPSESVKDLQADVRFVERQLEKEPKSLALAVELAKLCLRVDNRDKAGQVVREALEVHPGDRQLLELRAQSAADLKEIESTYRELIKCFPNEPKYRLELSRDLVDASEFKKAKELLQPLTKTEAASIKAEALLLLAQISLEGNDAAKANEQLNEAKLADADAVATAEAHLLEGEICTALDKDKQAVEAYRKALAAEPGNVEAFECLIRLSLKMNEKDDALKYLRGYVDNMANGASSVMAAEWYLKLGRPDDAGELLRRHPPKDSGAGNRVLGLISFQRGRWDETARHLQNVEPLAADALHALIVSDLMLGRLSDAVLRLDKTTLKLPGASAELDKDAAAVRYLQARRETIRAGRGGKAIEPETVDRFVCAEYLHSLGRPAAEVQSLLAKALADRAELGEAYGLAAELLLERGQLTKALVAAEKGMNLSPLDARAWYIRGRIRLEREQRGATADLQQAAELSGQKNAFILHWLAASLIRDLQIDTAKKIQEKAAKLRPDDVEIKEQLRQIESVLSRK